MKLQIIKDLEAACRNLGITISGSQSDGCILVGTQKE